MPCVAPPCPPPPAPPTCLARPCVATPCAIIKPGGLNGWGPSVCSTRLSNPHPPTTRTPTTRTPTHAAHTTATKTTLISSMNKFVFFLLALLAVLCSATAFPTPLSNTTTVSIEVTKTTVSSTGKTTTITLKVTETISFVATPDMPATDLPAKDLPTATTTPANLPLLLTLLGAIRNTTPTLPKPTDLPTILVHSFRACPVPSANASFMCPVPLRSPTTLPIFHVHPLPAYLSPMSPALFADDSTIVWFVPFSPVNVSGESQELHGGKGAASTHQASRGARGTPRWGGLAGQVVGCLLALAACLLCTTLVKQTNTKTMAAAVVAMLGQTLSALGRFIVGLFYLGWLAFATWVWPVLLVLLGFAGLALAQGIWPEWEEAVTDDEARAPTAAVAAALAAPPLLILPHNPDLIHVLEFFLGPPFKFPQDKPYFVYQGYTRGSLRRMAYDHLLDWARRTVRCQATYGPAGWPLLFMEDKVSFVFGVIKEILVHANGMDEEVMEKAVALALEAADVYESTGDARFQKLAMLLRAAPILESMCVYRHNGPLRWDQRLDGNSFQINTVVKRERERLKRDHTQKTKKTTHSRQCTTSFFCLLLLAAVYLSSFPFLFPWVAARQRRRRFAILVAGASTSNKGFPTRPTTPPHKTPPPPPRALPYRPLVASTWPSLPPKGSWRLAD